MTKISAKVIADSKNEFGNRITTMIVTFPRIILAEFNTHRMFSRNSASSRAIPFEKMVKSVEENPFIPIAWQKDHKGMQGTEYFNSDDASSNKEAWLRARNFAVCQAKLLALDYGVTKQLCNRLLEPFMWHTVIVTATEWENFFALRCPQYEIASDGEIDENGDLLYRNFRSKKDAIEFFDINSIKGDEKEFWLQANRGQAEIHMMALAEAMWDAYNESIPKELKAGEWHIPFGDNIDIYKMNGQLNHEPLSLPATEAQQKWIRMHKIKIATARCARVSYTVVGEEGKLDNYENDIKLHDRLVASGHWSPFEHCAKAMDYKEFGQESGIIKKNSWEHGWSGNFRGFIQYRKMIENEMGEL